MIEPITGRCDFCQLNEPKHTINGGLWWICADCYHDHYGQEDEDDDEDEGGEEE